MKRIIPYIGVAPKLGGTGNLEYCLWIDDKGMLYVQIIKNDATGTFSTLAFSVAKYASLLDGADLLSPLEGYDIDSKNFKNTDDNNNIGFLKAIFAHLFDIKDDS
jgi:hypothetical protein